VFSLIQVDSLSIVVLDWDSLSSPDVLGAVTLPSSLMRRIASSPIGYQTCWHATGTKTDPELSKYDLMPCRWWGESRLEVQLDGKVLLGNDGQRCVVHLRVETLAAAATLDPPKTQTPVSGPRRIQVKTENSTNLSFEKWCDRLHALSDVSK
jgi:hypothetical protein